MLKLSFGVCLILYQLFILTHCFCELNRNYELNERAFIGRKFGTKLIKIPRHESSINFEKDEIFKAFCPNGFRNIKGTSLINVQCTRDGYYYNQNKNLEGAEHENSGDYTSRINSFDCTPPQLKIYENKVPFAWCNSTAQANVGSYIIKYSSSIEETVYLEMCFNIDTMTIQQISYFSSQQFQNNTYTLTSFNNEPLKDQLIEQFQSILPSCRTPITEDRYEYAALIEAGLHEDLLEQLNNVLDIVWWKDVRRLNWARYMLALKKRIQNKLYKINAGTLGFVKEPVLKDDWYSVEALEILTALEKQDHPAYIWNTLQAVDGSEEFAIIAYNSPYAHIFDESDIVFCKSICNRIAWLQSARKTFRSPVGLIFCCTLDDFKGILSKIQN